MKKIYKIFICLLLTLCLMPFSNALAETPADSKTIDTLTSELLYYYGQEARTDVLRTLDLMKEKSEEDYNTWDSVIHYWDWIEKDMKENIDVAPDGLPHNNKHAFIVLGFALKSDGTMEDELVGRLEVALNSAKKYPDSYVLVTGGVEKNGWTEGERMHDWLVDHGLSEDRIIVEKESANTAQNAAYSFDILYNDYDISTVSLISSQYHIKRGSILYYTMSLLKAKGLGKQPITFLGNGNAGWYRADKTEEPLSLKVNSMYAIAGVEKSDDLPLSKLENLQVDGELEYTLHEPLNLQVTVQYDNGYTRDVTKQSSIIGFDASKTGYQQLHVTYQENGKTVSKTIRINVIAEKTSITKMQYLVKSLREEEEISDDKTAQALHVHLAAVKQFEETNQMEKVWKHLENFKALLDYQRNKGQISDNAYEKLMNDTAYLIKHYTKTTTETAA
ncbi:YdcF family protein [Virgibacillus halophilus]